ncbi:MAG TPA: hypothetical protein VFK02_28885 [Kofleriaceae bacterium]|nr:hypothetical protein [Kofleriaceae bacterium]
MMIATRPRWFLAAVVGMGLVIGAGFSAPARAQSAEAETLFREGKRLMKKGQVAKACEKFDAADRLEATAGTEINLADCREKNGQVATAWATFVKTAATAKHAGDGEREAEARRRAALLEPKLVYLTITVPAESRVDGLMIKRNDTVLDEVLWDQKLPVDPDEYTISAEAPGHEKWSTSVVVKTKSKKVEVPVLERRSEPRRAVPVAPPAGEVGVREREREPAPPPRSLTGRRKLSLVIAGIGVAAIGVGAGFGILAGRDEDKSDELCPEIMCSSEHGVDLNQRARRDALIANIGFAAGGVAIAGAAVLWLTGSPKSTEALSFAPLVGAGQVGVSFARSF